MSVIIQATLFHRSRCEAVQSLYAAAKRESLMEEALPDIERLIELGISEKAACGIMAAAHNNF